MKIFPVSKITEIDQYTIENEPIKSIDLMERAAIEFTGAFDDCLDYDQFDVLVGPGNNGGDALAFARILLQGDFDNEVVVWIMCKEEDMSSDSVTNLNRLRLVSNSDIRFITKAEQIMPISENSVIIDGLFGSGLNRPLRGLASDIVKYVNKIPNRVVSIDIPSGLMGEDNRSNDLDSIIKADRTVSFQFNKLAFLFSENEKYTGRISVKNIGLHPHAIEKTFTPYELTEKEDIKKLLKTHGVFSHKGHNGHALLMAGNYGKMGTAILASRSCLKSGVGLLTSHVPRIGYPIIQMAVPEAMASIDQSDMLLSEFPDLSIYSAVGIGPGIGIKPNTQSMLKELLGSLNGRPIVMDADALNILAGDKSLWKLVPENAILTPHPGEFDRLVGTSCNSYDRLQKAIKLAKELQVTLVLKGAYTAVISPGGICYFNSTGNAGMATAGSGDVLTGILVALLAQKYEPLNAARLGVYVHGLAADLLLAEQAEEGIIASDIISKIGVAFKHLRR